MIIGKRLLQCAVLLVGCVGLAQTAAGPARQAHKVRDGRMFAPYLDVVQVPGDLSQIRAASGVSFFTLAFVNADHGCNPSWPGGQLVANDNRIATSIAKLRREGGDVIIAFGGYEGTELAQACGDVSSLQSAYQKVIDTYKAKTLDLDIEHLAIEDQASIDRRSIVLKNLAQANPGLQINFTLPATPAGLTDQAVNVLKSAAAQGAPVHIVNVMAMDYGPYATSKDMGANAIAAIEGAQNQLKQLGIDAKLGITPMLGMNDVKGEVFKPEDAAKVLSYALKNQNVALLAFWSVSRDNRSCIGTVSPTCSGIRQRPWEFSHLFAAFR